jgi:hypothetical protein
MTRRPAALVSVPLARLAGYALLATVGSLQWVRYVEGASSTRAILWAAAGTATGALVIAARRRPVWLGLAVVAGALLAVAASGLDFHYLKPKHLDELGDGLARGAEALNTVRLPYLGKEPWVLTTVQLSGAGICWLAALLATWPTGGRTRAGALLLLLTLAAAPVVSLGADKPALLGVALAALTAAFLWLERLARRPGLGAIALAALVAVTAVPLGAAADREEPWFDYKAFSEKLSGGVPVTFTWDHDYGPINWTRDGIELFRVQSDRPHYWKADVLNTFDDDKWSSLVREDTGDKPTDDLARGKRRKAWDTTFSVAMRRLKTPTVIGAGTVLGVSDATTEVEPDIVPGLWDAANGKDLSKGDSYRVHAYIPQPSQAQLAGATVGRDTRRAAALRIQIAIRPDAIDDTPSVPAPTSGQEVHQDYVDLIFAPYESGRRPRAEFRQLGLVGSGTRALRDSRYERTWKLVRRLKAGSDTPYQYLLAVNNHLRAPDFTYTEDPDPPARGVPPLESFLFDSKRGYCQQFSGSMALLLRMGGVPARVVTGFSPGGQRASSGEWVVRDTDAHSWVEAWFDGLGWVTFDPTPPQTPARSQIAAINPPQPDSAGGSDAASPLQRNRRPSGAQAEDPVPSGGGAGAADGGTPWPWIGIGALLALGIMAAAIVITRRRAALSTPEAALADLERALRRSGRSAPAGTTLTELERRLGTSSTGYLKALRSARYAGASAGPSPEQRAAFRRELALGLGWGGRLRAYYALPPNLRLRRPR